MIDRRWLVGAALAGSACAGTGRLQAPPAAPSAAECSIEPAAALTCFAPVVLQETATRLDSPTALDPDGSGRLGDDLAAWERGVRAPPVFYATAASDDEHLYLFYALYYAADWSGVSTRPRIDHAGDLEGALVVVARDWRRVEAVITQAHKRLYLWWASSDGPAAAVGTVGLTAAGRPLLFSEAGGHGLYAFGAGRWAPKGGTRYPSGTSAVPAERLTRIEGATVVPLDALRRFTRDRGAAAPFVDLPRGASPPWLWKSPAGVARGAIVNDPAALYRALAGDHRHQ